MWFEEFSFRGFLQKVEKQNGGGSGRYGGGGNGPKTISPPVTRGDLNSHFKKYPQGWF